MSLKLQRTFRSQLALSFQFFVLTVFCAVALATASRPPYEYQPDSGQEPVKYVFAWSVLDSASGNDFGHQEQRDDDNTHGSYYVRLPDGRLQKVTYYVNGDSGYVAEVTYDGEANFDHPPQPPQPSYGR